MTEQESKKIKGLRRQLLELQARMQTGVAWVDELEGQEKHLRVGLNSAMVDAGALAKLLITKGVFTEVEYWEALIEMMTLEVEKYQARMEARYPGTKIVLGPAGVFKPDGSEFEG